MYCRTACGRPATRPDGDPGSSPADRLRLQRPPRARLAPSRARGKMRPVAPPARRSPGVARTRSNRWPPRRPAMLNPPPSSNGTPKHWRPLAIELLHGLAGRVQPEPEGAVAAPPWQARRANGIEMPDSLAGPGQRSATHRPQGDTPPRCLVLHLPPPRPAQRRTRHLAADRLPAPTTARLALCASQVLPGYGYLFLPCSFDHLTTVCPTGFRARGALWPKWLRAPEKFETAPYQWGTPSRWQFLRN